MQRPCLFAFDMNSHLARIFKVKAPENQIPQHAGAFHLGEPVFCLKPLLALVEREMRAVYDLGIENSHVVMTFDAPGKNFRHHLFPQYKANREKKPFEWSRQAKLMYDMFKSLGYPCLRVDNVEADDVLHTLGHKLSAHEVDVVFFTGDKDIMSGCNKHVSVYVGREKKLMTEKDVEKRFGLPTNRVLDFLAIKGDDADNVDGIPNVGDKKAVKILSEFSLQEVIENPDLMSSLSLQGGKKIVAWLHENKEKIILSRKLVDLKKNVPLGMNFKDMIRTAPDHRSFLNGYMAPSY